MSEKKEYIERVALIAFVREVRKKLPKDSKDFFTRDEMLLNFQQYVEIQPAADVEPVVRCRYCENGYVPKSDGSYVWCKMFNQSLPFDFYCKYAKEESINPCNNCEHAPSMCGMDIADCAHMDERSDEK